MNSVFIAVRSSGSRPYSRVALARRGPYFLEHGEADMSHLIPRGRPPIADNDAFIARMYEVERLEMALWDIFLEAGVAITPDQRLKCRACRALDGLTADRLAAQIRREGRIGVPDDPAGDEVAAVFASLRKASWIDSLLLLRAMLAESVPIGREFKALYEERNPELGAVFLAHRLALRDFVEAELAGDTDRSLDPILALLSRLDRCDLHQETDQR
jgi:hypothetical protein